MDICEIAEKHFPGERISIIHDHGFNGQAQKAFAGVKHHDNLRSLVTIAPMEWQRCIALQPADLLNLA
jgi:hypothetical protein